MAIFERQVTVWHLCGECADGTAVWEVAEYPAMVAYSGAKQENSGRADPRRRLTGFLMADRGRLAEGHGAENGDGGCLPGAGMLSARDADSLLGVGTDRMAVGSWGAYGTPARAAAAGARLYMATYSARPPRFSDGLLVSWCHFEAERDG